jgi:hypothetical protein
LLTPWSWAIAGFSLLVTIGTVVFATMLSVHTGSSVAAHSKSIESQYQVAQALTQEESDNLNIATCDQFLAANPKIAACNAVMVTELAAASDVAKRRRHLPEVTTTITLYFEAGNEVSAADLGALVEPAITGAAEEVIPDNAVTGITYTVSELEEVSEEDIPACANVSDGCGATEAVCAGGEYWNGSKCTKCAEYKYTETGVYASASGDSNDKGCKPCGADEDLQTWLTEFFDDPLIVDYYTAWTNKDEIIASMLKYSPAGSEGVDSCVANCNFGTYWNGEECSPCDVDTYLGFETYTYDDDTEDTTATYDPDSTPSPKYGSGTGNSELCIACSTFDDPTNSEYGTTQGDEGSPQCILEYRP